jgi:hypothetical protein
VGSDILILLYLFMSKLLMTFRPLLYLLPLPVSTCPDKISQQSRSYTLYFSLKENEIE